MSHAHHQPLQPRRGFLYYVASCYVANILTIKYVNLSMFGISDALAV